MSTLLHGRSDEREFSLDRALVDLAQLIGRCTPDRLAGFRAICEYATNFLSVDRASVWLYDDSNSGIDCVTLFERKLGKHSAAMRLEAKEYPVYFAALGTARIIAADDACSDPRTAEFEESYLLPQGIGAMMDAPIRVGGRHVGVLCNESVGPPRAWSEEDCALAGTLGDFAALCIESCDRAAAEEERRLVESRLARAQRVGGLGRLAGGISHDFNNLLTVIRGNLELMRMELERGEVDTAALQNEIETMDHAINRATLLTRKLAGVSHSEVADVRTVDPTRTIKDLARSLQLSTSDRLDVVAHSTPDTPSIEMDAKQFENIVAELAQNSIDAMPNGGRLWMHTDFCPDTGRHGSLELTVSDTGNGISQQSLPLIFEPFYSTKEIDHGLGEAGGWGLGLVEVQSLVEAQGGKIFVRSEIGLGTTFRVLLPAAVEPALDPPAGTVPATTNALGGGGTVLLCEDDDNIREQLRNVLLADGYEVLVAADGSEALDLVEQNRERIALLLTDVVMPGATGPRIATLIRKSRPNLKVLFISGYSSDSLERDGLDASDAEFLPKPFRPSDALRRVQELLAV